MPIKQNIRRHVAVLKERERTPPRNHVSVFRVACQTPRQAGLLRLFGSQAAAMETASPLRSHNHGVADRPQPSSHALFGIIGGLTNFMLENTAPENHQVAGVACLRYLEPSLTSRSS